MAETHSRDGGGADGGVEERLASALQAAEASPEDESHWELLEELAGELQRPDEVAELYRKVLGQELSHELADSLGKRAAEFHEEWFSEDAPQLAEVLTRVLERDPTAEWALQRVTVVMTVSERWGELLGLYDRALAATRDAARREQLLDEAASLAKDFAGAPDRAIDYLTQLLELRPSDAQLVSSLERLLERQERWQELIALWRKRLEGLSAADALAMRERIATCYLDDLGDAGACLAEVRALLEDGADPTANLALLERIVALEGAASDVRRGALDILRERYSEEGRAEDVIRVVEVALPFADGAERIALHRELGARLATSGDAERSMAHWAEVLRLDPSAEDAQEQLAHLAEQAGAHQRYAEALVAAADAASPGPRRFALLVEAGDVRGSTLVDREGAIELYQRVLSADARPQMKLTVARRVEKLLDEAERHAERLGVLEELAQLESDPVERRRVLGQCARLAEKLGEPDRALGFWTQRLEADASDLEALDAMIELTERENRWELHVDALRRRVAASEYDVQRRLDLARIAHTQASRLDRIDEAIETWRHVAETFGEDRETVDALFELLVRSGRFEESFDVLSRASERDAERAAEVLARVGDLCREHLGRSDDAAKAYHRAVTMVPDHERALGGLRALLDVPEARGSAVRGLAKAYELTGDWQATLGLLEERLELAWHDGERVELLREAAELHEKHGNDAAAAFSALRRALGFAPASAELEAELLRLAEASGSWAEAADSLAEAARALADVRPERAADLYRREASLREEKLSDASAALEAWAAALALVPHDVETASQVIRTAALTGLWDSAAAAFVSASIARRELLTELVSSLEAYAEEAGAFAAVAAGIAASTPKPGEVDPALGRALEGTAAEWLRDRASDPEGAEAALRRALAHDGTHTETLRELARLEWRTPGRSLVDTLLQLADHFPDDLDPLDDAARIALELGEVSLATSILERLARSGRRLWESGTAPTGERSAEDSTTWAQGELVRLALESEDHARAVELLIDLAHMPVAPEVSREMRRRAGQLCRDRLGDEDRALRLLASVVEESAEDAEAVAELGALLEARGRFPELLALRQRQLELDLDADTRLVVRLEVARVLGAIEAQGGRVGILQANLAERPGHEASIEELAQILSSRGAWTELAELLAAQAAEVEEQNEPTRAASLWARAAGILERELGDVDAALKAYRRVVALDPNPAALDALARLYLGRGEPAVAAEWLERRLDTADDEERAALALQLADAHLEAGNDTAAVATLEAMVAADPGAAEARARLATLYRNAEQYEPLAKLLAEGAPHEPDPERRLAYVREAAQLYEEKLGQPDQAIPVLQMGVELAPGDAELKSKLALGLRVAGRLDEARAILEELASSFGRRRSPERALVHYQLAQVAHAAGDLEEAMEQLEQARKMDMSHPGILRMAGQMAREAGQLERAEKAYRALLLVVRRQDPGSPDVMVGASEVLCELSLLATDQKDPAQAKELLESALSIAAQHDAEAERFKKDLLARGAVNVALRAIEMRLAQVDSPASEARMLAHKAEILDEHLDRGEEALDALLRAVTLAPGEASLHERCRALAKRTGAVKHYADTLAELAGKLRRKDEALDAAGLWLRLGEVTEEDLGDLDEAAKLYEKVEKLGVRVVDAWKALARVADLRGDGAEEVRVLGKLVASEDPNIPNEARTQALYRIAEVELASGAIDEGLANLRRALEREPRYARAGAILQVASKDAPESDALLELYEEVARASGDSAMILDVLEHKIARPSATLEQVREGVERADALGEPERAEALLVRGAELARASEGGLREALWVPIALAERRQAAGDISAALEHMRSAAEAADGNEATELWIRVAELATQPGGDLPLAARTYRELLESDPTNRNLWEPLAQVYAQLEDREGLEEVVRTTLDALFDPVDRNELRMWHARFLLEVVGDEAQADAIVVLKDVLDEDPDHEEAASRLAALFEASGDTAELVELLHRQLDRARNRQDVDSIAALSLRMGKLVEADDRHAAMDHYRAGLEWAPEHRELLAALLELQGAEQEQRERAEMTERLLRVTTGPEAARIANELIELYRELGDESGEARALDLGFKGCPSDAALRERLEAYHREREDWDELAAMIRYDAEHREDDAEAVARFREAAAILRETSPARAAEVLRAALERAPEELSLLEELVHDLVEAGLQSEAAADVAGALERQSEPTSVRAHLLRMRASLELALGNTAPALTDLEEAYGIDPASSAEALVEALDAHRRAGIDEETERATTHRLAAVLRDMGDEARSRDVLAEWVERVPNDRDALRILRDVDTQAERWEDVVRHLSRLVEVEEGGEQVAAALALAEACRTLGQPETARLGLESALSAQPSDEGLRAALQQLYEDIGAYRELASMLRDDADATEEEESRFLLLRRAGELLVAAGDPEAALDPLTQAFALRADDPELVVALADAYMGSGRLQEAVELLQDAINGFKRRRSPHLAAMQLRMSRIAGVSGDPETQKEWLSVALEADKNNGDVAAELAELAIALGDDDTALKALRVVTLLKTPGPMSKAVAFLRQAQIAHRQGDGQKAVLWARRARMEDESLVEAQEFLAQLGEN